MKLSRTIVYAIQATLELARAEPNRPISCSQLAKHGNLPERFLLHVLRRLVTQGILHSTRGVDGGYFLSKTPSQITLLDIVESFDTTLHPHVPDLQGLPSHVRKPLMTALEQSAVAARQELQRLTVADLLHQQD